MDQATAKTLLQELLRHLPTGWWCLVHQKNETDLGLAKAFGRPLAEINALLVNAGICKETGRGTSFVKRSWETFCTSKMLLDQVCCEKVPQPELHVDKTKSCPKLIPLRCTHGKNGKESD